MPGHAQIVGPLPDAVRVEFGIISGWYVKYLDADGIPVVGSAHVSDRALRKARANALTLLRTMPVSVTATLRAQRNRIVIVGLSETVRDIPEYAAAFPDTSRDAGYWGGFGATRSLPITSGTEANLLQRDDSRENVFVHELGHTIAELGLVVTDSGFAAELTAAFAHARASGLWARTYAGSSEGEYWAEGIQSYFAVNREGPRGGDGVHNHANTRDELEDHDLRLFQLIERIYRGANLQTG